MLGSPALMNLRSGSVQVLFLQKVVAQVKWLVSGQGKGGGSCEASVESMEAGSSSS